VVPLVYAAVVHLIRRGRVWYIAWRENGRKVRESTGFTDKKAAETAFRKKQRELADPAHHAAHEATIRSAAERFLDELDDEDVADGTRDMYETKIAHVARLLGSTKLIDLTTSHVTAFTKARAGEGASRGTIHKELVALRRTLKSAARAGELSRDPRGVMPKYSARYKPKEQIVPDADLWAVMAHLDAGRACWVALMVATSARLGEAKRVRTEDLGKDSVRLRGTKTASSARTVPILSMFAPWIDYVRQHADGDPKGLLLRPWGNLRRDLHAACDRAGVKRFGPNQLRHTTATKLVRAGVPFDLAAKVLGHRSTSMLQRVYGHLDASDVGSLIESHLARVHVGSTRVH
jgi:integrase